MAEVVASSDILTEILVFKSFYLIVGAVLALLRGMIRKANAGREV